MESVGNLDDFSSLQFCALSPADSDTSTESSCHGLKAAPKNLEGNTHGRHETTHLPSAHLDFLNLIFPPTPEKSPNFETCFEQEIVMETTEGSAKSVSTQTTKSPQYVAYKIGKAVNFMQVDEHDQLVLEDEKTTTSNSPSEDIDKTDDEAQNESKAFNSNETRESKVKRSLIFPPCVICTGKASGSHYGAITCEACKGFFRRYLQKKEKYICSKGGTCEIINRNRGNCSGCRLKKCLDLGMSKEKSKMGRYTLTKRTEAIMKMNRLQGKADTNDLVTGENVIFPGREGDSKERESSTDYDPDSEIIGRKISQDFKNLNMSNGFNQGLVAELVQAMNEIMPYGPDVKTKQDVQERHRFHSERYKQMIELFGRMNSVSKEEYNKLYKGYGIDIDGRMEAMKKCCKDIEGVVEQYCNFAKHIPGFHNLPYKDQSSLLKVARADFFIIVMNDAFSKEFNTFLGQDGKGYHIEEVADKFLSRELVLGMCDVYTRWQKLELSEEEKALVGALTLVFTDRCKLENPTAVEKIQYELVEFIHMELQKHNKVTGQKRFTRIIDTLTSMRDVSELYLKEYNLMCKDDIIAEELPMLCEFFLEEYDNIAK